MAGYDTQTGECITPEVSRRRYLMSKRKSALYAFIAGTVALLYCSLPLTAGMGKFSLFETPNFPGLLYQTLEGYTHPAIPAEITDSVNMGCEMYTRPGSNDTCQDSRDFHAPTKLTFVIQGASDPQTDTVYFYHHWGVGDTIQTYQQSPGAYRYKLSAWQCVRSLVGSTPIIIMLWCFTLGIFLLLPEHLDKMPKRYTYLAIFFGSWLVLLWILKWISYELERPNGAAWFGASLFGVIFGLAIVYFVVRHYYRRTQV